MQMQATAGYAGGQIPNPYMAYGAPDGPPHRRGGRLPAHEAWRRGMRGCRPSAAGSSLCRHCPPCADNGS